LFPFELAEQFIRWSVTQVDWSITWTSNIIYMYIFNIVRWNTWMSMKILFWNGQSDASALRNMKIYITQNCSFWTLMLTYIHSRFAQSRQSTLTQNPTKYQRFLICFWFWFYSYLHSFFATQRTN
jgi:hypothetical protein